MVIDAIITHGTDASVSGRAIAADNLPLAFCQVVKPTTFSPGFNAAIANNFI